MWGTYLSPDANKLFLKDRFMRKLDMRTLTGYSLPLRNYYKNSDMIMALHFKSCHLPDSRTETVTNEINVWNFASREFRSGEVEDRETGNHKDHKLVIAEPLKLFCIKKKKKVA